MEQHNCPLKPSPIVGCIQARMPYFLTNHERIPTPQTHALDGMSTTRLIINNAQSATMARVISAEGEPDSCYHYFRVPFNITFYKKQVITFTTTTKKSSLKNIHKKSANTSSGETNDRR